MSEPSRSLWIKSMRQLISTGNPACFSAPSAGSNDIPSPFAQKGKLTQNLGHVQSALVERSWVLLRRCGATERGNLVRPLQ
jgi:hypothetical protein